MSNVHVWYTEISVDKGPMQINKYFTKEPKKYPPRLKLVNILPKILQQMKNSKSKSVGVQIFYYSLCFNDLILKELTEESRCISVSVCVIDF